MLSRALKGGVRECTTATSSRCIKLPPSPAGSPPVGSLSEELLFDYTPCPQPVPAPPPPQSPFAKLAVTHQVQLPSLCHPATSASTTHDRPVLPPARTHHAPWHSNMMGYTTSAPTISATLAATASLNRAALSAVSMAMLAEDEENGRSPASSASRLGTTTSSSIPRCRSVPMSIAPSQGTSLVTALEMQVRAEQQRATATVPGSVPARRIVRPGRPGQEEDDFFQPPHEIAAASYCETFANPSASLLRRQSIANRLKSVVFEQTGMVASSCGKQFLGPVN